MRERLTRQEQQERNRLRLLDAAEKVFAERGIQGASLDEVAAEAGLTKGAIYSNFAGKEDLVLAVMRHRLGEEARAQAQRGLSPDTPPERLVGDFGDYWAARLRTDEQRRYLRFVGELVIHALRHDDIREQLRTLVFAPTPAGRHPLAPPGSDLARLPPSHADAILKALDLGMGLLCLVDPDRCPPELFRAALRLLAGLRAD